MCILSKKRISIAAALVLSFHCGTALTASSALAADMLEDQGTTQVEYGTGWYLRGDIGYTFNQNYSATDLSVSDRAGNQSVAGYEGDGSFSFGAGVGYRFSDTIRADLGYRYLGSGDFSAKQTGATPTKPCENAFVQVTRVDQFGNPITLLQGGHNIENCTTEDASSYDLQAMMVNAYYDFDQPIWGVKPFLGLGLGVIRNRYKSLTGTVTCTPNSFELCAPTDGGSVEIGEEYTQQGDGLDGTAYHLAGAVHAGFSVPMGDDLYFDTMYTYTRMAEDASWGGTSGVNVAGIPQDFHSIRLGLRWEIW